MQKVQKWTLCVLKMFLCLFSPLNWAFALFFLDPTDEIPVCLWLNTEVNLALSSLKNWLASSYPALLYDLCSCYCHTWLSLRWSHFYLPDKKKWHFYWVLKIFLWIVMHSSPVEICSDLLPFPSSALKFSREILLPLPPGTCTYYIFALVPTHWPERWFMTWLVAVGGAKQVEVVSARWKAGTVSGNLSEDQRQ